MATDLALRYPDRVRALVLLEGDATRELAPDLREPTEAMADALPNARTALVAGGHLINPAAPEILAFIQELLASP